MSLCATLCAGGGHCRRLPTRRREPRGGCDFNPKTSRRQQGQSSLRRAPWESNSPPRRAPGAPAAAIDCCTMLYPFDRARAGSGAAHKLAVIRPSSGAAQAGCSCVSGRRDAMGKVLMLLGWWVGLPSQSQR